MPDRRDLLQELVTSPEGADVIARALAEFPSDSDTQLVSFDAADLYAVLEQYVSGALEQGAVERWADVIEGRDDIAFDPDSAQALLVLTTPELNGPLTPQLARHLMCALTGGDDTSLVWWVNTVSWLCLGLGVLWVAGPTLGRAGLVPWSWPTEIPGGFLAVTSFFLLRRHNWARLVVICLLGFGLLVQGFTLIATLLGDFGWSTVLSAASVLLIGATISFLGRPRVVVIFRRKSS